MLFLTISNENIFFKTQDTRLGAIVAPNKDIGIGPGCTVILLHLHSQTFNSNFQVFWAIFCNLETSLENMEKQSHSQQIFYSFIFCREKKLRQLYFIYRPRHSFLVTLKLVWKTWENISLFSLEKKLRQ